ncbi:hypothetical protein [Paenibacillus sp. GCM10027626]|uniref:hypothetical protein n=1 Tax=Paenibacillus sp. GCM10027626 TaxID=3273411 RepID=UPI003638E578
MGVGPAGLAMRIGRPINWDDRVSSNVCHGHECPLMIVEQLRCAVAHPILLERGINAVLLVARRTSLRYADSELAVSGEAVKALVPLFLK